MRVHIEIKGTIEINEDDYKPEDFGFDEGVPLVEVLEEILQEEYENGDLDPEFTDVSTFSFMAVPIND